MRARPQAGLDAVALGRAEVERTGQALVEAVLARHVHLVVVHVPARGHHHAFAGVDADGLLVGVFRIGANHAVAFLDEADQLGGGHEGAAHFLVVLHDGREHGRLVGRGVVGGIDGAMAGRRIPDGT